MDTISSQSLLETTVTILKKLKSPKYKNMSYIEKYNAIFDEHDNFCTRTGGLLKAILDEEDLAPIAMYVYYLDKIEKGELTLMQVEETMRDVLAKIYLPEKHFNEYKKMMESNSNSNSNLNSNSNSNSNSNAS
jgi:hypothetical protein